jgi:hypothetical protein
MDERVKFIARLLDGEAMSRLCEEFEISRKTGYTILQRYRACGGGGADRSLAPALPACQSTPPLDRDPDRAAETGEAGLGRAQDPGAARPALPRCAPAGDQCENWSNPDP